MAERSTEQEPTVAGLGEAGVLELILPRLRGADMLLGPGDDAAIIAAPGERFVITVDTMVQDQDFRLRWPSGRNSSGFDTGWKSAAQNLSDVNAMGAIATSAVISLTLPPTTEVSWVESFADGFSAAVRELGASECSLAGGDLSRGTEISVTTAVTGKLTEAGAVLRSGAVTGDVVAVGGALGAAAAGLVELENPDPPDRRADIVEAFIEGQLRPRPLLTAGPAAAAAGATAMMDISDGLLRDVPRLARASGVAIDISTTRLAAASAPGIGQWALERDLDSLDFILRAGEDFALLATFPPAATLPEGFVPIGTVIHRDPSGSLSVDGTNLGDGGWDHFSERSDGT